MRVGTRLLGAVVVVFWNSAALAAEPATQSAGRALPSDAPRIHVDARINDVPVLLIFDTGSEQTILFRRSAERLNLKVTDPPPGVVLPPGKVAAGKTEECRLSIGDAEARGELRVYDVPAHAEPLLKFDGVVGWTTIRQNLCRIRAGDLQLTPLEALPADIAEWTRYYLPKDLPVLAFQVPTGQGARMRVVIDTGAPDGVYLAEDLWRQWRRENADAPTTLNASWIPVVGTTVDEVCWAAKVALGPFSITEVPVTQSHRVALRAYHDLGIRAELGLFALSRLEVITDWQNAALYVRPARGTQWPYPQNRLGAVFVPPDRESLDLAAHVLDGSPAHEAGIRAEDLLLKIDELDVTRWRTDPSVLPLSRFWSLPAGTRLRLTLQRNGDSYETTVELRDMLTRREERGDP